MKPMNEADLKAVEHMNAHAPVVVATLNGRVIFFDKQAGKLTMEFNISRDFCHSVDVVQGGIVTGMLDAAMSHAVFAVKDFAIRPPATYEIKVSFLAPARAGRLLAHGHVLKLGRSTAFLEADLEDEQGTLLARATSTTMAVPRSSSQAQGPATVG